jgi:hypothetical protein
MNSVICPGCQKSYAKGLSFQVHKRSCRKLAVAIQGLYKKHENNQGASGSKTARYDDTSVDNLVFHHQNLRDQVNSGIDLPHAKSSSLLVSAFSFLPLQKNNILR